MDFFNNLQDYFANLSGEETIFFWLVAGLLFVTGLLIGLLLRGRSLKSYKNQYLITDKERAELEANYLNSSAKEKALQKEVATLSREKVALYEQLEEIKTQPTVGQPDEEEIRELQDQVQLLRSENQRLLAANNGGSQLQDATADDQQSSSSRNGSTNGQTPTTPPEDLNDYLDAAEARFQAFEQRLSELANENRQLHGEVSELRQADTNSGSDRSIGSPGSPYGQPHQPIIGGQGDVKEVDGEPLVIRADVTNSGVKTDDNGGMEVIVDTTPSVIVPILPPDGVTADDLKLIRNIGPFMEKKLNEQGIYTYEQIAGWSAADIERITKATGYLPGAIEKADWVGQAKELDKAPKTVKQPIEKSEVKVIAAKKRKKSNPIKTDNLKAIEGIGPKIESVLKDGGIKSLEELAAASPDSIREILAAAGSRFKVHNPDSWPQQAALARDGKLEELKALQDSM